MQLLAKGGKMGCNKGEVGRQQSAEPNVKNMRLQTHHWPPGPYLLQTNAVPPPTLTQSVYIYLYIKQKKVQDLNRCK